MASMGPAPFVAEKMAFEIVRTTPKLITTIRKLLLGNLLYNTIDKNEITDNARSKKAVK